jgi:hypothetical protein
LLQLSVCYLAALFPKIGRAILSLLAMVRWFTWRLSTNNNFPISTNKINGVSTQRVIAEIPLQAKAAAQKQLPRVEPRPVLQLQKSYLGIETSHRVGASTDWPASVMPARSAQFTACTLRLGACPAKVAWATFKFRSRSSQAAWSIP